MMEVLGAPQTHLGLKAMIQEVDEDGDGQISFREVSDFPRWLLSVFGGELGGGRKIIWTEPRDRQPCFRSFLPAKQKAGNTFARVTRIVRPTGNHLLDRCFRHAFIKRYNGTSLHWTPFHQAFLLECSVIWVFCYSKNCVFIELIIRSFHNIPCGINNAVSENYIIRNWYVLLAQNLKYGMKHESKNNAILHCFETFLINLISIKYLIYFKL